MREHDAEPDTPLLWVLREQIALTGTKYGCGIAQCGACTVHLDGAPVRSCVLPVSAVQPNQKIVTIEGLAPNGNHPLQKAWVANDVPQCGYCQSGMIMAAVARAGQRRRLRHHCKSFAFAEMPRLTLWPIASWITGSTLYRPRQAGAN